MRAPARVLAIARACIWIRALVPWPFYVAYSPPLRCLIVSSPSRRRTTFEAMEDVGRVGVSVETEFNRYPYNPGQVCWTVATVKSSHLIDRSPAEIVVVVDKSGSMDGVMKLVKDALKHITQRRKCIVDIPCYTIKGRQI